jgi:hypothetical protein
MGTSRFTVIKYEEQRNNSQAVRDKHLKVGTTRTEIKECQFYMKIIICTDRKGEWKASFVHRDENSYSELDRHSRSIKELQKWSPYVIKKIITIEV